jgi:hypothetical protein
MDIYKLEMLGPAAMDELMSFYACNKSPYVPDRYDWAWWQSLETANVAVVRHNGCIVAAGAVFHLHPSGAAELAALLRSPAAPSRLQLGKDLISALMLQHLTSLPLDRYCAGTKAENVRVNRLLEDMQFHHFDPASWWLGYVKQRPTIIEHIDTASEVANGEKHLWTIAVQDLKTLAQRQLQIGRNRTVVLPGGEIAVVDYSALSCMRCGTLEYKAMRALAATDDAQLPEWNSLSSFLRRPVRSLGHPDMRKALRAVSSGNGSAQPS